MSRANPRAAEEKGKSDSSDASEYSDGTESTRYVPLHLILIFELLSF